MKAPTPSQKVAWKQQSIKPVPDRARILQWNIVPGDFVRKRPTPTSPTEKLEVFEVLSIDKLQNKVFLKGTTDKNKEARSLPYAACQLYLGDFYVGGKDRTPVFATRVGSTSLKYNWRAKRFEWVRFAEATAPRLAPDGPKRRVIPWPVEPEKQWNAKENKFCDTSAEDALVKSWSPFTPGKKVPKHLENAYISDLFGKTKSAAPWQDSLPMEHFLLKELSNPLSRARRQERWQENMEMLENSKQEYVQRELVELRGRKKQDATKDGVFRWKLAVQKYKARTRWQRWIKRGGQAQLNKRLKRRHRLSTRRVRRLKAFKLHTGKNQVIPDNSPAHRKAAAA